MAIKPITGVWSSPVNWRALRRSRAPSTDWPKSSSTNQYSDASAPPYLGPRNWSGYVNPSESLPFIPREYAMSWTWSTGTIEDFRREDLKLRR